MASLVTILDASPISAEEYNKIHLIHDGTDPIALPHLDLLAAAIHKHGMNEHFSIHLLHRHFALPEGHVLASSIVSDMELHVPVAVKNNSGRQLHGTQYLLNQAGCFQPYEFSLGDDEGATLLHADRLVNFLQDFAAIIRHHGLQDKVALQRGVSADSQREVVGADWTVHWDCCLKPSCLQCRTIAVGWRADAQSGRPRVCTNWYIDTSPQGNGHRVGNGGDSIEPLIDASDPTKVEGFLRDLQATVMCC